MKAPLTIQERVDRLLVEGVENPSQWMPIKGYEEPQGEVKDWYYEWERLRAHHTDETNALFDIIEELTKRVSNGNQGNDSGTR